MARRLPRLKRHVWLTMLAILVVVILGNVIYVAAYSRSAYTISETTVDAKKFPNAFNGFSMALISDVHLNKETDLIRFNQMLKALNEKNVDMVLFAGDLYASKIFNATTLTKDLKAVKAPYGKFAVLGDEDQKNKSQVTAILNDGGFEVLDNEKRPIYYKEHKIMLEGLSINGKATASNDGYTIILTHYPDSFKNNAAKCDLQLSGHSGGGYIVLPIIGGLIKSSHATAYVHGTYQKGNARLIISNGVAPIADTPYKFGAKNEIKIITLRYDSV